MKSASCLELQIQKWPDRKRKVLSAVDGNTSVALATFVSDEAAELFLRAINERLVAAYYLGKQSVAVNEPPQGEVRPEVGWVS